MKYIFICIISFFLIAVSTPLDVEAAGHNKFYPLPLIETEIILSNWLTDSHFSIIKSSSAREEININATRGYERWIIILNPHSPLASFITATYTLNGEVDKSKSKEIYSYLNNYSESLHSSQDNLYDKFPSAVQSQTESAVCVRAKKKNRTINFSGFILDKKGLIVSTAHDLDDILSVTVIFNNGSEFEGHLIKTDYIKDLTVIYINYNFNYSISLSNSRNLLDKGERVYSISCSSSNQSGIVPGLINWPLRVVNKQPLWHVSMETLPGSSGSPVFDAHGNLVGIVKGRDREDHLMGYLITAGTLIEFLKDKY